MLDVSEYFEGKVKSMDFHAETPPRVAVQTDYTCTYG